MSSGYRSWFKEIFLWAKKLFKKTKPYQKVNILSKEYNAKSNSVLLEIERNSHAAVGSFQVCNGESIANLLILVDNLYKIRRYNKTGTANLEVKRFDPSLEALLVKNLGASQNLSHRITIAWVKPGSFRFLKIIGIWDVNFIERRFLEYSFGEDKVAYEVARAAAREVMKLNPVIGQLWQERVNRYNWEEWFTQKSNRLLGKEHELSIKKIDFK